MIKKIAYQILPPFISSLLKKIVIKTGLISEKTVYRPSWHKIKEGILKNREIYVDPRDGYWQRDMINGSFDKFFIDYLNELDMNGKTIFEIGAHIGYHAMNFAQFVGPSGMVFAFEPNRYNIERFNLILTKNKDLADRIEILEMAVSNNADGAEFSFSRHIDDGTSTGSFIAGAHTPFQNSEYEKIGFKKIFVQTISLDKICSKLGAEKHPYLIKIDVEGAENLVLEGGKNIISRIRPILLIEVHTFFNMLQINQFFNEINYKIKLLHESRDGRCFIAAESN